MEIRRDVFQAIADPTRRNIINLITHQSLTPNELSENFDVSRQAISKHLQILTECGLIAVKQYGRERHYEAKLDLLDDVTQWIDEQRELWLGRFNKIDRVLETGKKRTKRKK